MAGGNVSLQLGIEPQDRYGRTLAYLYAGDTFCNGDMVRQGYATPLSIDAVKKNTE